jgi:hypothetical protein
MKPLIPWLKIKLKNLCLYIVQMTSKVANQGTTKLCCPCPSLLLPSPTSSFSQFSSPLSIIQRRYRLMHHSLSATTPPSTAVP